MATGGCLGILDTNANERLAYFATDVLNAGLTVTTSGSPGSPVAVNFSVYAFVPVVLRWVCLTYGERWLRAVRK